MKKIIALFILIVIFLSALYYYRATKEHLPFRCDGQIHNQTVTPTGNVQLNAYISVIFTAENTGTMYTVGSVKDEHTSYILHRHSLFSIKPSPIKGSNNIIFTQEQIHPLDNTPDKLWHNFILPQVDNVDFNVEIKPVNQNALLIQGLSIPFIICINPVKS
ncbi:FidL-like protein [Serratia sp. L9]|uniref:FidL-like protein n=1 Tax=Serratia sp. L9 TaxID=3423946 RepID=UPI003D67D48E